MTPAINERLKVEEFDSRHDAGKWYDITNDSGDLADNYSVIDPPEKETAERMVACWNAFLGVPTAEILAKANSPETQS